MTEYAWPSEPNLRISSSRMPIAIYSLSGVVLIKEEGVGYCHVKFKQGVVKALGKKMPRGIGPENTAYLFVMKKHDHYDVCISYTDLSSTVRLWRSDKLPHWAKNIKHHDR